MLNGVGFPVESANFGVVFAHENMVVGDQVAGPVDEKSGSDIGNTAVVS